MDSLTLKRHNSFQNENNIKATHSFAARPLIFKLPQKVLKFNDIFMSWSFPKLTRWQIFLTLKIEILRRSVFLLNNDISLHNNLFISFLNQFISLIELKNIH